MLRATWMLGPALLSCLIVGCAPRVGSERSRIATFPRYRTFAWAAPAGPAATPAESGAALLDWRIHAAVDRALAAHGYERISGPASLLVDYDVVPATNSSSAFRVYFRDRRSGGENLGDMASGFAPGTLVAYLVDARTRELAYRAWAFEIIDDAVRPDRVDDAVARMFAPLPAAMDGRDRR